MNKYYLFGVFMFFIGIFITLFTEISLTGAAVGVRDADQFLGLMGFAVTFLGIILMITSEDLENIIIENHIEDSGLLRYKKRALRNQFIKKEMEHLIEHLSKGNIQAGLGMRHVEGTDINYMRGNNGAKLFFRRIGNSYIVVGESSGIGKKNDEMRVIKRLQLLYEHKLLYGQEKYSEDYSFSSF